MVLQAIRAQAGSIKKLRHWGLAAQLMAPTWLCVVPITNDNIIPLRNITCQANKADQIILYIFVLIRAIFFKHTNCLLRL